MNRNVAQLVVAQAIMMSVSSLMVTSASIIGSHLAENPAWASLPLALQFIAVTASTIPASLLMQAIGRRAGFLVASVIGILGAACAALGIYLDSFLLFLLRYARHRNIHGVWSLLSLRGSRGWFPRHARILQSATFLLAALSPPSSGPIWPT